MEFSSTVLSALQTSGDCLKLPDNIFSVLVDGMFDILCQRSDENIEDIVAIKSGIDVENVKESYFGLLTVTVEATRTNSQTESLNAILDECNWPADRIELYNKAYNRNKEELQVVFARYGPTFPHIVDVKWRLDYRLKTNQLERINEPLYFVNLQTEKPGNIGDFNFACSIEQLQDLVSKLKDASKALEKASEM